MRSKASRSVSVEAVLAIGVFQQLGTQWDEYDLGDLCFPLWSHTSQVSHQSHCFSSVGQ